MQTKQRAQEEYDQSHFLLKCPHCGAELVIGARELHDKYTPYQPHEESYVYYQAEGNKLTKKIGKHYITSDLNKDAYKDIKCCYCGHVWDELVACMHNKYCQPNGSQNIVIKLNETETEKARAFMKKHDHSEDYKREGKMAFSTLGQQYTYTITPGGLGNLVIIKCNYCGETEDITDTENW